MASQFHYSVERVSETLQKIFVHEPSYFKTQLGTSHECTLDHTHNYMQLWYCLHGSFRHVVNGQAFTQRAGDFIVVPPYCSHQIDTSNSDPDLRFIFCDLSDDFLAIFPESNEKSTLFNLVYLRPMLMGAQEMRPFLSFNGETAKKIEALYMELLHEFKNSSESSHPYIRATLIRLLTLIAQEYETVMPTKEDLLYKKYRTAIQDALDYIESNYTDNITLSQIAKISLMSVRSFSFVFKHITGKTFLEYLQSLRVHRACNLLRNSNETLTQICIHCGFSDITYFGRVFKKITGMSPSSYRKEYQKN